MTLDDDFNKFIPIHSKDDGINMELCIETCPCKHYVKLNGKIKTMSARDCVNLLKKCEYKDTDVIKNILKTHFHDSKDSDNENNCIIV
jgi:hypothetical protein